MNNQSKPVLTLKGALLLAVLSLIAIFLPPRSPYTHTGTPRSSFPVCGQVESVRFLPSGDATSIAISLKLKRLDEEAQRIQEFLIVGGVKGEDLVLGGTFRLFRDPNGVVRATLAEPECREIQQRFY